MTTTDRELPSSSFAKGTKASKAPWFLALGAAFLACAVILVAGIGAIGDPRKSLFAFVSALPWATVGPHLVLVSFIGPLIAVGGIFRGPRRFASVTLAIALTSLVVSTAITGQIVGATIAAGGTASPFSGLALGSMRSALPDRREVLTTVDGQPMHAVIYEPRAIASTPAAIFMYIHGGGWILGSADEPEHDLRWLADHEWLVVSIEYPLASPSKPTWEKAPQTVACGLVWTAKNAESLGADSNHIVVGGDSAGGNLAVNLSYAAAMGKAVSNCGGTVPVPAAVVVQYPIVDPVAAYDDGYPSPGFSPREFVYEYIGGNPAEFPERMAAITSATYLSAKAPQTLLIEPGKDGLIPTTSVHTFARRARAAGVDVTLIDVPFAGHAYNQVAAGSIGNQAGLSITQHYLERRGIVGSHPTSNSVNYGAMAVITSAFGR